MQYTQLAAQPFRGVPYPSTLENVATNLQQEPTLAGQFFMDQYGLARWDAQRVDTTIDFAERWSKLHDAPVYCGEFGVHRPFADEAMRAFWLHDMRIALEKRHICWAMWDYQDNFGVDQEERDDHARFRNPRCPRPQRSKVNSNCNLATINPEQQSTCSVAALANWGLR